MGATCIKVLREPPQTTRCDPGRDSRPFVRVAEDLYAKEIQELRREGQSGGRRTPELTTLELARKHNLGERERHLARGTDYRVRLHVSVRWSFSSGVAS
ncbi:hypothetical protein GCM10009578_091480 [Streptomyces rhizosphaericus]